MNLSQGQVNRILKGVYDGKYTRRKLPLSFYKANSGDLLKAIQKGFGVRNLTSKSKYFEAISELSENAHMFSAAKTYQMVRELQQVKRLTKTYPEYKEASSSVFDRYAETWQVPEVDSALAQAMNLKKWMMILEDRDVLPNLRYSAVGGKDTCDICNHLDGIVAPIDDSIWKKYAPQNHYACRCILIQEPGDTKLSSKARLSKVDGQLSEKVSPVFMQNVGETKQIFPKDHPYFSEVSKQDRAFARKNFGLPIPEMNGK